MKKNAILTVVALSFVCGAIGFLQSAGAESLKNPGLVGIQYGSEDFTDAENLVTLSSLEQTWTEDDNPGREWSGKWVGFVVGPKRPGQFHGNNGPGSKGRDIRYCRD
jgi:hypothetical protein